MLRESWRSWTESWSAPGGPRRTRWVYALMALGFGGLAIAAAVSGDAAVAALAGVASVATASLAALASRLARWTGARGRRIQ